MQVGGDPDFLQKPLSAQYGSELGVKNFDRDFAIMFLVVGQIDGGHATASELPLDYIDSERSLNLFQAIGHSRRRPSRRSHQFLESRVCP